MQLKIDEFFAEKEIPANDSVRLINQTVEEMDLTSLLSTYKRTGRPDGNASCDNAADANDLDKAT